MERTYMFDNLFLGAGAMKAGTTWTYAIVRKLPELFFTHEKEIHYFYHKYEKTGILSDEARLRNAKNKYLGFDPERANPNGVRRRLHWVANYLSTPVDDFWYRNLFNDRRSETYGCDFSNLYALLSEDAWKRIGADVQNLKVLYTMRDPIKRLWSHVRFHLQVTGQLEKLDTWDAAGYERFARKPHIWENCEYGRAVRNMTRSLSTEQLKICFFEDLHADQRGFLYELEEFLGIEHIDYPQELLDTRVNESISRPMPDFFPGLFEADFKRIAGELGDLGHPPPASWQVQ